MDELKWMNGEPVWVAILTDVKFGSWRVVLEYRAALDDMLFQGAVIMACNEYGKAWLAYRCKPDNTQA